MKPIKFKLFIKLLKEQTEGTSVDWIGFHKTIDGLAEKALNDAFEQETAP